jgi:hypothetical protein
MNYSKYVFSRHESFLCNTLWLKKGYDLNNILSGDNNVVVCTLLAIFKKN